MSSSIDVCESCGREVAAATGAELRVAFRDGSGGKAAVLCQSCATDLPGAMRRIDEATGGGGHPATVRFESSLANLPERHRAALLWFAQREGVEVGWPEALPDGTLLVCRPKGIYKPHWSDYALSVRESLERKYPDEEPIRLRDGGWSYRYFQENPSIDSRDREYTNVALLACMRDGIPVGVLKQVVAKPKSLYFILGTAFVRSWQNGYFQLEGAAVS